MTLWSALTLLRPFFEPNLFTFRISSSEKKIWQKKFGSKKFRYKVDAASCMTLTLLCVSALYCLVRQNLCCCSINEIKLCYEKNRRHKTSEKAYFTPISSGASEYCMCKSLISELFSAWRFTFSIRLFILSWAVSSISIKQIVDWLKKNILNDIFKFD